MKNRDGKFLYVDLADRIQAQIDSGAFKLSAKLPSLRVLCQDTGYSMTTVLQAYIELEKRGIVESRQRSGYFIKARLERLRDRPEMKPHAMIPKKVALDDLIHQLTQDMGTPDLLNLGSVAVAPGHLPVRRLHKHLKSIPQKRIPDVIAGYGHPQGDVLLRQQIANLLFPIIPAVQAEDIIVTNGCTEALSLGLRAVCNPGDTVIMESPTDPWLRQTVKDSGLLALEVPTDPDTGIDIASVKKIIAQEAIAACMLNPNCQNPLGFIMPAENKRALAELLGSHSIPIIENDVCGELYFGERRPSPVIKWDAADNVIYCSSFSKVLAPGLRIGWVVSGRYMEAIKRLKLNQSLVSPALNQAVVANYLKEGTFHRHLRKLRRTMRLQYSYCATALEKHLPRSVRMTSPSGGQSIWVELPDGIHGRAVYDRAREHGISILPGILCTSYDTFDHCIRIGYGGVWGKATEQAVGRVGAIIEKLR